MTRKYMTKEEFAKYQENTEKIKKIAQDIGIELDEDELERLNPPLSEEEVLDLEKRNK